MKRTHLAAILASLALALPSCGGDDEKGDSAPAAAGTSPAAQSEQPKPSAAVPDDSSPAPDPKNGDGGSAATDAERIAAGDQEAAKDATGEPTKKAAPKPKRKARAPKTPAERVAALSPSDRRKLHHDLYEQGKQVCYAYGPKELAKNYNLPSSDPETIARLYARAYEAAAPALILPFQQGCLAGFRRFERNPPKN